MNKSREFSIANVAGDFAPEGLRNSLPSSSSATPVLLDDQDLPADLETYYNIQTNDRVSVMRLVPGDYLFGKLRFEFNSDLPNKTQTLLVTVPRSPSGLLPFFSISSVADFSVGFLGDDQHLGTMKVTTQVSNFRKITLSTLELEVVDLTVAMTIRDKNSIGDRAFFKATVDIEFWGRDFI